MFVECYEIYFPIFFIIITCVEFIILIYIYIFFIRIETYTALIIICYRIYNI